MDNSFVFQLLAAILVLAGLIGVMLPVLPGLPLVFAGLLLSAWADGFQHVGAVRLTLLALLTLASLGIDFWAAAHGAKRVGASRTALIGATLGMLIGAFVFPPFGFFLGPFVGALAGELLHRRSLTQADLGAATRIGVGTWLGIALGVALKLAIAGLMLGLFASGWLFNH
ncbi:DUF456 domain-containing protein [Solilutibacter silvestris]|uniref:DUF456 domain-containing protein n=1 Tax=Solilutibacter silvestris TaxID=1645665 RepID=UPI000CA04D81|nr:DUF456 domain-containing protein [Lysobacter silvestris]